MKNHKVCGLKVCVLLHLKDFLSLYKIMFYKFVIEESILAVAVPITSLKITLFNSI